MSSTDLLILRVSGTIEHCLNETLSICRSITISYKKELSDSPFIINLLDDALRSERLKETAHSRILYRILHDRSLLKKFIECFLPDVEYFSNSIQIPYPDKHRIDLTIKSNKFFLIIENKVNDAPEQPSQIEKYVKIAQQTYPMEQIYVLYLGGEENVEPSENSLSIETRKLMCNRVICKNFKDDITPWIESVYEQIIFNEQPFLKSTLLIYKTYLENKYRLNKNEMNNKLDKALIEALELETIPVDEKIKVIEDQIANVDKIKERLSFLLDDYSQQSQIEDIKKWYDQCIKALSDKVNLTMETNIEFGLDFKYKRLDFRCNVSYDNYTYDNYKKPYWGIFAKKENVNMHTRPTIFNSLKQLVLQSNKGFHNNENNPPEWVISDCEEKELIVDRFVSLANLICDSEVCSIVG